MTGVAYLLAGLVMGALIGAGVAFVIWRGRVEAAVAGARLEAEAEHGARASVLGAKLSAAEGLVAELRSRMAQTEDALEKTRAELSASGSREAQSVARLDETRKSLEEHRAAVADMERKLTESFKALSMEALSKNTDEFLKIADKTLKMQADMGKKELSGKKELIDQSLEDMGKRLVVMQQKMEQIGQGNMERIGEVTLSVKHQAELTARLAETTESLRRTLASSKKRGEWGERMAEDVIRLVGLREGINYMKQKTLDHASGRPDYTFFLPNSLKINMDVKFPMDNYLHFLEAENDADRKRFRDELMRNTRTMIKQVTTRDYINTAESTVDYVIVFIPNEQVYGFINESDPTIMDESLKQKVILCSPFTLYAVLSVVRQAVENFNLEQTASEILRHLGAFYKQWEIYKERFKVLGERLDSTRKEYDALQTTRSNQLEKPLLKIEEIRTKKSIPINETLTLE